MLWEFPGGKVEQNENPKFCLARELKEEFNIVTNVKEFLLETSHDYGTININLKTYFASKEYEFTKKKLI